MSDRSDLEDRGTRLSDRSDLEGRFALLSGAGEDGLMRRLRQEGMKVAALEVDLHDRASCDQAVADAIRTAGGGLDVFVSIEAMRLDGPLEATPEPAFRELLERNLTAAFRIGRACFAAMRERGGGSMIFIGSDAGIRAAHENAANSVASAGVIALAELFAAEGAGHRIRANAVSPRAGIDIAPVVAWLASGESSRVSGATIRVDDASGAAMVVDTRVA